ncbi:MAG: DUF448 domain-containing protein [Erythrobacter sp.]|nr:DUF448 domain-containing protein [Erythrobacter sp.]
MRTPPNERLTSDIVEPALSVAAAKEPGSERRCILSGDTSARDDLLRLAISPDGLVLPDVAGKAPGRGAWITPERALLETALAEGTLRKGLMRAFKGASLTIPDDLADRIAAALSRQLCDRLGLELRSGQIVLGSARIEEQARSGRIAALLHASDSSEDGRRKLDQAWRVGSDAEGSGMRGEVLPLDRTALSVALGRENVVHLGVAGHHRDMRAAKRVAHAVTRLAGYLGGPGMQKMNDTGRDAPDLSDRTTSGPATLDEYVKD